MPGVASLEQQEYYAHPRNAFWPIMGDLFGAGFDIPYARRLEKLTKSDIALWDVLDTCFRPGSLDSDISDAAAEPNDFVSLFAENTLIRHIFFNGRKAADVFRRKILAGLGAGADELIFRTLPSTSPAHAARTYEQKLREWSVVRDMQSSS